MKKLSGALILVLLIIVAALPAAADTSMPPATPDNVSNAAATPDTFQDAIINNVDTAECIDTDSFTITKVESNANVRTVGQNAVTSNTIAANGKVDQSAANNKKTQSIKYIAKHTVDPSIIEKSKMTSSNVVNTSPNTTPNDSSFTRADQMMTAPADAGATLDVQKETLAANASPVATLHDEIVITAPIVSSLRKK